MLSSVPLTFLSLLHSLSISFCAACCSPDSVQPHERVNKIFPIWSDFYSLTSCVSRSPLIPKCRSSLNWECSPHPHLELNGFFFLTFLLCLEIRLLLPSSLVNSNSTFNCQFKDFFFCEIPQSSHSPKSELLSHWFLIDSYSIRCFCINYWFTCLILAFSYDQPEGKEHTLFSLSNLNLSDSNSP